MALTKITNRMLNQDLSDKTDLGSAKAWIYFNGTGTPTILASFNITSLVDNGSGDFTINFTVPFSSVNYSVVGFAGGGDDGGNPEIISTDNSANQLAGSFKCQTYTDSAAATQGDVSIANLVFFGSQ